MKKHFDFSRDQKIGIATISVVIIVLTLLLNVNNHLGPTENELVGLNEIQFDKIEGSFSNNTQNVSTKYSDKDKGSVINLLKFNPNDLSVSGWEDLGFSIKQAKSIVKYRESYGPFQKSSDVSKIYVISDEKFKEIEPFMVFKNIKDTTSTPTINDLVNFKSVEINSASKEELESINGIGAVFSDRIIKYRSILGGFFSSTQFQEVYGLKDESLLALIDNVEIDPAKIKKININSATKNELKKHPYLKGWDVISSILKERDNSKIENLNFLIDQGFLSLSEKEKIEPYINY